MHAADSFRDSFASAVASLADALVKVAMVHIAELDADSFTVVSPTRLGGQNLAALIQDFNFVVIAVVWVVNFLGSRLSFLVFVIVASLALKDQG